MGYVMERGALVDKMFYTIQLAFRNVPASLAVAIADRVHLLGHRQRPGRRGRRADGRHRLQPDAACGLRREARRRRHHGRRHARHPDPALGDDHRLRGRGRAVGGEALCGGDVPRLLPGVALSRSTSSAGRCSIRKIAPPLPEEQTRVPVPAWMPQFQAAYSQNMFVGADQGAALAVQGARDRGRGWPHRLLDAAQELCATRWCRSPSSPARWRRSGGTWSSTSRGVPRRS